MIGDLLGVLLGGGRNAIRETVEVFRPNAEAEAVREAARTAAALSQFAAEFQIERRGLFDRFVDALNRLPRPMLALGTLGLFVSAMTDPIWFAERMQGIALVPEPLWWLMGAIVSFYFGARHQAKTHELQRSLAETLARAPEVVRGLEQLNSERPEEVVEDDQVVVAETHVPRRSDIKSSGNAALDDWRRSLGR
ncbi:MAG: holin family protein [Paracoccaceae bacterium]|nr:holin family protein [Paracoccaceae bacterium]